MLRVFGVPSRSSLTLRLCSVAGISLALLLNAASATSSESMDWRRFRGPNGSGFNEAPNLPVTWTDEDYRWKATLPGMGHASPVVSGGKVFVLCGDKTTAKRCLVVLRTSDGGEVWKREYESATFPKNRDNSFASSTPALDDQRVYVYWTTLEEVTVVALEQSSGREVWKRSLGPYKSQHGSGTSPIVLQGLVIINNDQEGPSSLIALDARTGVTRWEITRRKDRASYSTPLVREVASGKEELIFTSSGHGITALEPITGKINWEMTNAFPLRVVGSPILAEGLIVGACGEGGVGRRVVAVKPPQSGGKPELVYEMKNSIPYVPTPLCHSGLLFLWGDNGLVSCHRATTGDRVWQRKISDSFYCSPVCDGPRLYCVSKSGNVYVLSATEKDQLLATVALGEPSFATPAIAENALFFRSESHVFCLPAK